MKTVLSTHNQHDRLTYWNDIIAQTLIPFEVSALENRPFFGKVASDNIGFATISEVTSDRSVAQRTNRLIAQQTEERVLVLFQLGGESLLQQDRREAHMRPGDWALATSIRPFDVQLATNGYCHLVVELPTHTLLPRFPLIDSLTATTFSSQSGLSQVTFEFVQSLWRQMEHMSDNTLGQMANTLVDLLSTGLSERRQLTSASVRSKTVTLLEIKRLVSQQLRDPQLSAAAVAAQLYISESYLHRLFKNDGTTFGRYMWASRLEHSRVDLADPRYSHRSISDIAFSWGFNSLNHFSHAFKKQFGVSPRDFRLDR